MSTWYIDPSHSNVTFGVKHMMVSTVRGRFGRVSGTVDFDPDQPESTKIRAALDATTVDTSDAKRDGHLRSADFFDTEKHPEITFTSTSVQPKGENAFVVSGDLTIRGVTKPVTFKAEVDGIAVDGQGGKHLGASGTLSIDRREFGLVWNQPLAQGVLVGDTVKVDLGLAAIDEATARKYGMVQPAAA